jgi:hypothetical protein
MIRKLEVVFGNWKVVFGNWTVVSETRQWYSETGQWYSETGTWYSETGLGKLGVVFGNLGVVFGNWVLHSETDIIGNWNPGTENPRDTTTERWFDFFPSAELFNGGDPGVRPWKHKMGVAQCPQCLLAAASMRCCKSCRGENGFVDVALDLQKVYPFHHAKSHGSVTDPNVGRNTIHAN